MARGPLSRLALEPHPAPLPGGLDWHADDRVLIALGLPHATVRADPPRSLDDAERRVTELALANVVDPAFPDPARRVSP